MSPYDITKAENRDYDDHIDFLISKKKFNDAIKAFEKPPNNIEKPRRHTRKVRFQNEKIK